jgi:hypothetical protein
MSGFCVHGNFRKWVACRRIPVLMPSPKKQTMALRVSLADVEGVDPWIARVAEIKLPLQHCNVVEDDLERCGPDWKELLWLKNCCG